jgi:PASTA domain-containing protein
LTAAEGRWGGTPPFTYGYQWLRCTYGGGCTNISGATGATYTLTSAEVGTRVTVAVTATNAGGSATAYSDETETVIPVAPSNITAPSIDGAPYLGAELDAEDGDWSGTQPMTYSYRWQRCVAADSCEDIDGETESVYTVTADDLKRKLRVVVTASNGAGSATAVSSLTGRATRRPVCIVPRVTGKKLAVARRAIRKAHCAVGRLRRARSRRPKGRVVGQSLRPGLRRPMGTKVNIVVSRGRS